jgi:hypothetical protein
MSDSNALAVRMKVEAARPDIRIITPLTSRSGRWELEIGEADTPSYSDFWTMIDHLAGKFADIGELADGARPAPVEAGQGSRAAK